MSRDNSRIEVGSGRFPIVPSVVALLILGLLVLGVAYAGRTPFGAEVAASEGAESAVKEYLAKNEKRFVSRMTFYNCAGFYDSIFSGGQDLAAAAELGPWRPGIAPDGSTGNLVIVSARKEKEGEWQVSSKPVPGATYDPSPIEADDPKHPCNLR